MIGQSAHKKNDIGEMTTRKRGAWQKITRMNRWLSE